MFKASPFHPENSEVSSDEKVELWGRYYRNLKDNYLFPNEFVVRAFLGKYPKLKMEHRYENANICDVGCGDGRNIVLLNKLGGRIYATEVTDEICQVTAGKLKMHPEQISVDLRVGFNQSLPFGSDFFDYMLSWNALYYMRSEYSDIQEHVCEFGRVLKKDGYLVACVPSPKCFSLQGADKIGNHLIRINNSDPKWSFINGSIYYSFQSLEHIQEVFGTHFHNFSTCRLSDDCFGLDLEYFVFVCQKK